MVKDKPPLPPSGKKSPDPDLLNRFIQSWRQRFQEVLNRPEPEEPAEPKPSEITLDIDTGPPTTGEVKVAILAMKSK